MAYRDENEALHGRVEQLERELAEAKGTIARLRGEGTDEARASVDATSGRGDAIVGGPVTYDREAALPFEISETGYERIAALVQKRLSVQVAQVGHTLTAPNVLSLSREGGRTRVRLTGDWSGLVANVLVTTFFGGVAPGIMTLALVLAGKVPAGPLVALVIGGVGALTGWMLSRRSVKREARAQLEKHREVFAAILELANEHQVRAPRARVSVEVERAEEESADDDERSRRERSG